MRSVDGLSISISYRLYLLYHLCTVTRFGYILIATNSGSLSLSVVAYSSSSHEGSGEWVIIFRWLAELIALCVQQSVDRLM